MGNLSTTGSYGGTSVFDANTGSLTLTGNLTAINSRLQNITYVPSEDPVWTANYALNNPASLYTSYCSQDIKSPTSTFGLTSPSSYFYPNSSGNVILNTSQIIDPATSGINTGNIRLTLTPNSIIGIANLSTTGTSGAISTFDGNLKILTLIGNVSGINSHLQNIVYWPTNNYDQTWTATYNLNPTGIFSNVKAQNIISISGIYLTPTSGFTWDTNTIEYITNAPAIVDTGITANYTMKISSTTSNAISTLSTSGSGSSTFNNSTKELTIVGNITQVNQHLANVTLLPFTDRDSNFNLRYILTVPNGNVAVREQLASFGNYNIITSNLNESRLFVTNTADQTIFASDVPQITEVVLPTPTYTIELESNMGYFGNVGANVMANTYSLSGTKETINSLWSAIKFYPKLDYQSGYPITVKQYRNGDLQFTKSVDLIGTLRTEAIEGSGTYVYNTIGNVSFTPTYEQKNYLTCRITAIGNGGRIPTYSGYTCPSGAGGGGIARYAIGPGSGSGINFWMKPAYIDIDGTEFHQPATAGDSNSRYNYFTMPTDLRLWVGDGGDARMVTPPAIKNTYGGPNGYGTVQIPHPTSHWTAVGVPNTADKFTNSYLQPAFPGYLKWNISPYNGWAGAGAASTNVDNIAGAGYTFDGIGVCGKAGTGRQTTVEGGTVNGVPGGGYGGGAGGYVVNSETLGAIILEFYKD